MPIPAAGAGHCKRLGGTGQAAGPCLPQPVLVGALGMDGNGSVRS